MTFLGKKNKLPTMPKTITPIPAGLVPYHVSSHTRTAVNTDATGERLTDVVTSELSMHWHGGELRLVHRFVNLSRQREPRAPMRAARGRRYWP